MLKEKVIVISGASSGLGLSLALLALKEGAKLGLCARDVTNLASIAKDNEQNVFVASCDVSKYDDVKLFFDKVLNKFGHIDIVIANAGQSMWSRFSDISSPLELESLMAVNYLGVVNFLYYSLDELRKNHGSFVAISSIQGTIPTPYHSGYVAAKHAVNGFIDTMRLEESQVNFLLVCPGWISGTNIRENALKSQKPNAIKVKLSYKKNTISSFEVAKLILEAIKRKEIEIFIPHKFKYISLLRHFCRGLIDKIIKKSVEKQLFV